MAQERVPSLALVKAVMKLPVPYELNHYWSLVDSYITVQEISGNDLWLTEEF